MFKNSVGEIYLPNENRRRRLKIFEIIAIAVCVCEEEDIIIKGEEKRDGCCENGVCACGRFIMESYVFIFGYLDPPRNTFPALSNSPFLFVTTNVLLGLLGCVYCLWKS